MTREKYKGVWERKEDNKLVEQYIYLACHPRTTKESLSDIIGLLKPRGIETYTLENIQKEKYKAMQKPYTNDMEIVTRVCEALYSNTNKCSNCGKETIRKKECEQCEINKLKTDVREFIGIGFCKQSNYKPTVWKYATEIMTLLIQERIVEPYDYGRGKGKYCITLDEVSIEDIQDKYEQDRRMIAIVRRYNKYNK